MRQHLNTLYVTTQGAYLAAERETLVVRVEHEVKLRLPLHVLEGVVCFGRVSCSPFLMGRCADRGVGLSFLTERGRFLARVQGAVSGNVLLRRQQYRAADDPNASASVARACVAAKIANCRQVLQRAVRDHGRDGTNSVLPETIAALENSLVQVRDVDCVDSVRGIEGEASRAYFGAFDSLVTKQHEPFRFEKRTRRPPMNRMNAILSFVYTVIVHDVSSALEGVGLDPQVGFLHRDRPGRPGLALDMMEEFRPFLGDRLAVSLVNRRQIGPDGFEIRETGGVFMNDESRRALLEAYQARKDEKIRHPFLNETITVGMLPHLQALLLARHLRGDLDGYPPFFWR